MCLPSRCLTVGIHFTICICVFRNNVVHYFSSVTEFCVWNIPFPFRMMQFFLFTLSCTYRMAYEKVFCQWKRLIWTYLQFFWAPACKKRKVLLFVCICLYVWMCTVLTRSSTVAWPDCIDIWYYFIRPMNKTRKHMACHLLSRWFSCLACSSALNIEATCSSETSVDFQRTTCCYVPKNRTVYNHRCENLKFYKSRFVFRINVVSAMSVKLHVVLLHQLLCADK
jgi:hypothetical protein